MILAMKKMEVGGFAGIAVVVQHPIKLELPGCGLVVLGA